MSILSLRGRTDPPPRSEPPRIPYAPRPKPGPHQLGSATLAAVDQITGLSAEEIEKAAGQLIEAAHETADIMREAARRVRESGVVANERLANFVKVASTCADAAKMMQVSVERRDEPEPEPIADEQEPPSVDLEAIEQKVAEAPDKVNP